MKVKIEKIEKYQAICTGKNILDNIDSFQDGQTNTKCDDNITLLVVNLDLRMFAANEKVFKLFF